MAKTFLQQVREPFEKNYQDMNKSNSKAHFGIKITGTTRQRLMPAPNFSFADCFTKWMQV